MPQRRCSCGPASPSAARTERRERMPDPLEQLHTPDEPVAPRDSFRLSLRRQLFVALSLTVDDCDAAWERAIAAGAEGLRPPEDQPHGNRMAVLADPFGHRWFLLQPLEQFDLETYAERSKGTEFKVVARTTNGIWT